MEEVFLSIWRSILWGTEVELPENIDWQAVFSLASRHKGLHALCMWTKLHGIATPYDRQLAPRIAQTLQRQVRLNHLTTDIITLLSAHHIPATLIKGYGLSTLYPAPDMRDYGDVDIYVGEAYYEQAAQLLIASYPSAHWHSDLQGGIHFILVLDANQDRVVELHRVTMEFALPRGNAAYQSFTQQHLHPSYNTVTIFGQTVPCPTVVYNAVYIFMHAWHHFESTGVGWRSLGDWALCLHQFHQQSSAQQWKEAEQTIDQLLTVLHMKSIWQTFGHILIQDFQLPQAVFPLYTPRYQHKAIRLRKQLLRDGHGMRPTTWQIKEIALMRRFPFSRPSHHRVLQVIYTSCRLVFDAYQMGKFFPRWAWKTCGAKIYKSWTRRTDMP